MFDVHSNAKATSNIQHSTSNVKRKTMQSERSKPGSSLVAALVLHALLILLAFIALFPLLWMICAAFKQPGDLYAYTFLPWPRLNDLTLDNFHDLFASVPFGRWFANSLFVSSVQTVCVVTTSSLGGF